MTVEELIRELESMPQIEAIPNIPKDETGVYHYGKCPCGGKITAIRSVNKAFKILQMSCAEGTSKQEMDRLKEESAKRKKITREEAIKNIKKEMCKDCDYYYIFDGNCSIDCHVTDSIKALEEALTTI